MLINIPEDPAFGTRGRPFSNENCIQFSNYSSIFKNAFNRGLDDYFRIDHMLDFSSIKIWIHLNNGLAPILKAGSSGNKKSSSIIKTKTIPFELFLIPFEDLPSRSLVFAQILS